MEGQAVNPIASFLPLILIFVVFYFLLIQPQRKQKKQHEQMIKNLGKNDEVVTSGGIHGTILNVKETTVVLRVDDNAKLEVEKYSIAAVTKKRSGEEAGK
ncbi:MAG: preprotein translocase subunit YajC [Candidatus Omnitrophota bacterium]|nr:preprotein translocase subunit YajC [Candidatus Omnitrophota bacterium]MDP3786242.1 preprotein translocase subunit YajC [Candidatus Omnitrophota bacterium]